MNNNLTTEDKTHYGATVPTTPGIQEDAEMTWNELEERQASILPDKRSSSRNSMSNSFHSARQSVRESLAGIRDSLADSTAGQLLRQSVTLSLPGRECSIRSMGGTASISTEFFNLVKNLVGAGMLAIPVCNLRIKDANSCFVYFPL